MDSFSRCESESSITLIAKHDVWHGVYLYRKPVTHIKSFHVCFYGDHLKNKKGKMSRHNMYVMYVKKSKVCITIF